MRRSVVLVAKSLAGNLLIGLIQRYVMDVNSLIVVDMSRWLYLILISAKFIADVVSSLK